jgi:hypothetical protein
MESKFVADLLQIFLALMTLQFAKLPELIEQLANDFGGGTEVLRLSSALTEDEHAEAIAAYESAHKKRCAGVIPGGMYEKIFPGDGTFVKAAWNLFLTYVLPILVQKYVTPPVPAPASAPALQETSGSESGSSGSESSGSTS